MHGYDEMMWNGLSCEMYLAFSAANSTANAEFDNGASFAVANYDHLNLQIVKSLSVCDL